MSNAEPEMPVRHVCQCPGTCDRRVFVRALARHHRNFEASHVSVSASWGLEAFTILALFTSTPDFRTAAVT